MQPEWFNQSGIAEKEEYVVQFKDHATLYAGEESLYYAEYMDELYDYNTKERETYDPDVQPDLGPKAALSQMIAEIASWEQHGMEGATGNTALEKTQLTYLTLEEAQTQVEDMLEKLGIRQGYVCSTALDMSAERIRILGAAYNQAIHEGKLYTNSPEYD